jgi:uncharacterized membrane protein
MEWIKLGHVMFAAIWFGGTVYVEALMANAARTNDPQIRGIVAMRVGKTNLRVFSIAGLLTLVFGLWLVLAEDAWEFSDVFVSVGFLVAIIGIVLGIGFFTPQMKKIEAVIAERGPQDPEVAARGARISMGAHLMTLLLLVAMVFMVIRPGM